MTQTVNIGPQSMPSWRQQFGFFAAVVGMFMAILDIQIVASSLNQIQAGVSASRDEISWIQTSYLIAEIIMIPLAGGLARITSTRFLFVFSCAGFTLASIGCSLAGSINQMIVLRALQGFLGGAMIPLTQAISFTIFPRNKMNQVQAVIGLVATLAPSIGPTLGGYLTELFSWHWLFLINTLPGIFVCLGVWLCLDIDKPDRTLIKQLDIIGMMLLALFLGTLEFILEEGHKNDWFGSRMIFISTIICVLAGILMCWRLFSARYPIVQLRLFAQRDFAIGTFIMFFFGVALYGMAYLMPLYFGSVRGYSSLQIGETMFVTGVTMFVAAPILARVANWFSYRQLIFAGLFLIGLGSVINANLTNESGFYQFFWPQVIRGLGFICAIIAASRLALDKLQGVQIAQGAGLFNLMRNLGGAIGLAVIDSLLSNRQQFHWQQLIPYINTGRSEVLETLSQYSLMLQGAVADPQTSALQLIANRVMQQATVLAFNDLFLWIGALYFVMLPITLLIRRPPKLHN